MKGEQRFKEKMTMPNPDFSMKVMPSRVKGVNSTNISPHWHEEMELLYFTKGSSSIKCNNKSFTVHKGDLIIANCNDLHSGINLTEDVHYYCIILDPHILNSRLIDLCDSKYITPIIDNTLLFENHIVDNVAIQRCIELIIDEYTHRECGFELAIKAGLYNLLVLLLRKHVQVILTDSQVKSRMKNINRFNPIIQYIDTHYAEELSLEKISELAHMSKFHFCRLFKQMTGHTVTHYINSIRIQNAERLLASSDLSVSEIAYTVGFQDTSYFSRIFKSIKGISPSKKRI